MKNRFIGDTRIPSFNDANSTIDLTNYLDMEMPKYTGFTFQYIYILDIRQYNTTSTFYKNLEQYNIRFDDGEAEASNEMQDSYTRLDWDTKQGPPPQFMETEDGDIEAINGRRRFRGAIERGAKFIPIAVYTPDEGLTDEEVYQYLIEAAQKANNLIGSVRTNKKDDYIQTGVKFIKEGIIDGDRASVLTWLEDRMNYKERFLSASTQKEILNKIVELGNAPYELSIFMDTPKADAWAQENRYKEKDSNGNFDKNLFVVCVDNMRYADRLMADAIVPACIKIQRTDPVRIILYSKKRKPADIKKNTQTFVDAIETAYQNCFNLVRVVMPVLDPFIKDNIPEYRPWTIEGCIPQLVGEQEVYGGRLIPYEKVIANLPKKKKKAERTDFMEIDKALEVAA